MTEQNVEGTPEKCLNCPDRETCEDTTRLLIEASRMTVVRYAMLHPSLVLRYITMFDDPREGLNAMAEAVGKFMVDYYDTMNDRRQLTDPESAVEVSFEFLEGYIQKRVSAH